MKLSIKIGLITTAVAGLIALGVSLNHSFWENRAWRAELRSHAGTIAEMLNLSVQESLLRNDFSSLEYYLSQFDNRKDLAYVVVYDNVATPLASTKGAAAHEAILQYQDNPHQHNRDIHTHVINGEKIFEVLVPVVVEEKTWGLLQVGFYEDKILSVYHRTNTFNYLILLAGLVVCLAAGWGVAHYLGEPIEALTEGAEQLVKSNYNFRIPYRRKDELGKLVEAFNNMAGTISRNIIELESKNRELLKAQERQMWLSRIAEQVGDGVAVADLEGMITFVNQSWVKMHGYDDPREILGKHLSVSHSHRQLENEVIPFNEIVMAKGFNSGMVGHIRKDRSVFYTEMTTTLLRSPGGGPVGFIGVARDITEQKTIQDELRRERDLTRSIFSSTPDTIIITDLKGCFTDCNDKTLELIGCTARSEVLGKKFTDFIHPDDRPLAAHSFQKTLDYGQVNDIQITAVNVLQKAFPMEYSSRLVKTADGRPYYVISICRDISSRKKAELALLASEERFRKMAENIHEGMAIIEGGKVVFVNQRACQIYGCTAEEITKFNSMAIAAPEERERVREVVEKARSSGVFPEKLEFWIIRTDGQRRYVQYRYYDNIKDGKKLGYYVVFRDITEQKLAEQSLKDLNERFEYALGATKTGFDIIDEDFNISYIDPSWKKIYGNPEGVKCFQYFMGRTEACEDCGIKKAIAGNRKVVEEQYLKKENRWVEVHTIPFRGANGKWMAAEFNIDITERKKSIETIRQSEQRYRALAESSPDVIFVLDRQGKISYANDRAAAMVGITGDQARGRNIADFFPADLNERQKSQLLNVFETCQTAHYELPTPVRGRELWLETWLVPLYDAEGKVGEVMGLCRDFTERKNSEEALRQSEEKYRDLSDTLPQTVFEIDRQGIITYVNQTGLRQFGYEPLDLNSGINALQLMSPGDRSRAQANIARRLAGGQAENQEYNCIRKDGSVFPVSIYSRPMVKDGRIEGLRGVIVDVSEQKKNEKALRESEARYRALFDQASDGIMFMPADGSNFMVNQVFAQMHGYDSPEEMQNLKLADLDTPSTAALIPERLQRMLEGEALKFEVEHYHKDGHIFPLQVSCSAIRIGDQMYFLGFHHDITGRKAAEYALRESESKFRSLAETSPAAIFAYQDKFIYANPACEDLSGYSLKELLDMNFWEIVQPEFRTMVRERGQARQRGEKVSNHYEFKIIRKDGQERWIDFSGTMVNFEGQPAGMGMALDITERKAMEEILEASEEQYRSTIDALSDSVHVVDEGLNIILANATFKKWCHEMLGADDVIGVNVFDLCPFLTNEVRGEYQTVFDTGKALTTRDHNTVTGQLIITETRKIPVMEEGKAVKIITVMRDITREEEMAFKLEESEQKYQQVLEGVAEGIYRTTPEGKILLANQAMVNMLGYSSLDELMSRDIEKEGYTDHKMREDFINAMSEYGVVKNWVSEWKKKDGSFIVVRENAHVVKDNTGRVLYYEGTAEDITEQTKAQQKLLESERKYYQIFEDIVEGIYRSTPDGKLLLANPALVKMLGFGSFEEMAKIDLNKSGYMDNQTRKRFRELMDRDGQVLGFEARWRRTDGSILIISENARAVKDKSGNILFYEGTIEDITEKQTAQEALLNEKNKLADLFRVSLQVARAGDIQQKLDLTMEGISGTGLFRRVVLVLKDEQGANTHIAHFGMTDREVKSIIKSKPAKPEQLKKIFTNKYRYSNSYYVPHDAERVGFPVKLTNKKYKATGDWHADDVLIVPLIVKDTHIGYLTVDEPIDGKVPSLETVRLLELFTHQAAVAIDNLRLYNDLERSYYSTLKAFVAAMDAKDPYTKGHSENVRFHALRIARRLGLPEEQVRLIDFSSLLHDIGKLAIRDEILTKPSLLSEHEYQEVKLHPVIGSQLVSEVESLNTVAPIIHSHHEHFDGSGYPLGIKGDEIPLEARIIAVADAFEAMTSDRPYRKAFDYKIAIKRLKEAAGSQFDSEIVKVFVKLHQESNDKEA